MKYKAAILTLSLTSFFAPMAWAQDALKDAVDNPNSPLAGVTANQAHTEKSADEIARDLANPNSPLASLNGKLQYRTFDGNLPGASNKHSMTFLFQPVFPFALGETSSGAAQTLFVRPEIPYFFN
jgi:hypothetical protein